MKLVITSNHTTPQTRRYTTLWNINSFAAADNYSRHPGLMPQATIVDNVPSVSVSTKIDIYCILVKFTTYFILTGSGKLRTVVYFQKKIIRQQKS